MRHSNTLLVNTSQTSKCCNQHVKRIRHNPAVTTIQLLSQTRNARLPNQMLKHSSQNGTTNQRRPLTSKLSNTCVPHQTHRHWLKPSTIFMDVTRHKALQRFKLIIARRVHMSHCAQHPLHHNVRHWAHRSQLTQKSGTRDLCCNVWQVAFVTQLQNWQRTNTGRKLTKNNTTKHFPKNIPTKPPTNSCSPANFYRETRQSSTNFDIAHCVADFDFDFAE